MKELKFKFKLKSEKNKSIANIQVPNQNPIEVSNIGRVYLKFNPMFYGIFMS